MGSFPYGIWAFLGFGEDLAKKGKIALGIIPGPPAPKGGHLRVRWKNYVYV